MYLFVKFLIIRVEKSKYYQGRYSYKLLGNHLVGKFGVLKVGWQRKHWIQMRKCPGVKSNMAAAILTEMVSQSFVNNVNRWARTKGSLSNISTICNPS